MSGGSQRRLDRGDLRFGRSFRHSALPRLQAWVFLISGVFCVGFSVVAFWATRGEVTPGLMLGLVGAVVVGTLLLALPSFLRYQMALYYTRPLPDGIEEAFDRTYGDLANLAALLEEMREEVDALPQADARLREREDGLAGTLGEIEEELAQLRLEQEALLRRLGPAGPDDDDGGRPLPGDLVRRAMEARQGASEGGNPIIRSSARPSRG